MSEKQDKVNKILISYDLERRVGNVIPVGGGEPETTPTFNDEPDDVISGAIVIAAPGATKLSVASIPIRQVTLLADAANVGNILIPNLNPMFPLIPGAGQTIVVKDINRVYYSGLAGDILYFLAEKF